MRHDMEETGGYLKDDQLDDSAEPLEPSIIFSFLARRIIASEDKLIKSKEKMRMPIDGQLYYRRLRYG